MRHCFPVCAASVSATSSLFRWRWRLDGVGGAHWEKAGRCASQPAIVIREPGAPVKVLGLREDSCSYQPTRLKLAWALLRGGWPLLRGGWCHRAYRTSRETAGASRLWQLQAAAQHARAEPSKLGSAGGLCEAPDIPDHL